jgi:predicted nucleotide-binding protein (sugar kinase/HSP70/actin superfamily)
MEDLIKRLKIPNVALFALTSENSYLGLGNEFQLRLWNGIVISDVMEDIRSMLLANAQDTEAAIAIFNQEMSLILDEIGKGEFSHVETQLGNSVERIRRIPMKRSPEEVPTIALAGEIFVRRDALSRGYLTERLAQKGFATMCSPIAEWILYSDYLVDKGLVDCRMTKMEKLAFIVRKKFMARNEKRIKSILSETGMVHIGPLDVEAIVNNAIPYISPNLTGEAILTVGSSLAEIASHACGVIAIGPFGCMPNRLSEAILNQVMVSKEKLATDPTNESLRAVLSEMEHLPFLAVESDGSPFPQLITAKLEAFCLQAERLNDRMRSVRKKHRLKDAEIAGIDYCSGDLFRYYGVPNSYVAQFVPSGKN